MSPINAKVRFAFVGVVVLGVALYWLRPYLFPIKVQRGTEWPPLTMEYDIVSTGFRGESINLTYRHEYQDKYHWTNILLFDSSGPVEWVVKSNDEVNNGILLNFDPTTDVTPGSVRVPNEWLHPFYISKLLAQPNTVYSENGAVGTLFVTTSLPCTTPTGAMQAPGLGDCHSNRVETTEVAYRTADFIPLRIIESLDGIELRRTTITYLTVNGIRQPVVE